MSVNSFERYREPTFAVALFAGMLVFALGIAFLILGVAINTEPPAPFMTPTAKYTLIGISVIAIVVGAVTIRFAGKVVGW